MLKQRGSWQATGVKPTDLGIEFANMFTHEIEDFSEVLVKSTDKSDKEVRKFLSNTFQVCTCHDHSSQFDSEQATLVPFLHLS